MLRIINFANLFPVPVVFYLVHQSGSLLPLTGSSCGRIEGAIYLPCATLVDVLIQTSGSGISPCKRLWRTIMLIDVGGSVRMGDANRDRSVHTWVAWWTYVHVPMVVSALLCTHMRGSPNQRMQQCAAVRLMLESDVR